MSSGRAKEMKDTKKAAPKKKGDEAKLVAKSLNVNAHSGRNKDAHEVGVDENEDGEVDGRASAADEAEGDFDYAVSCRASAALLHGASGSVVKALLAAANSTIGDCSKRYQAASDTNAQYVVLANLASALDAAFDAGQPFQISGAAFLQGLGVAGYGAYLAYRARASATGGFADSAAAIRALAEALQLPNRTASAIVQAAAPLVAGSLRNQIAELERTMSIFGGCSSAEAALDIFNACRASIVQIGGGLHQPAPALARSEAYVAAMRGYVAEIDTLARQREEFAPAVAVPAVLAAPAAAPAVAVVAGRPRARVTCMRCGKKGHAAAHCFAEKPMNSPARRYVLPTNSYHASRYPPGELLCAVTDAPLAVSVRLASKWKSLDTTMV